MAIDCIDEVPGASELRTWFGGFPSFHDAYADLQISGDGTGHMRIKAFRITDKVDARGFFVLEKYCVVKLSFEEISAVNLVNFMKGSAIIFSLDIKKSSDVFDVVVESSYGFEGSLHARRVRIEFEPSARHDELG